MSQTKAQLLAGTSTQDIVADDATVSSLNGGPLAGARNRIINGDMRIDQRNAGAAVTVDNTSLFGCDRWQARIVGGGVASIQRSTIVPLGFTNSQSLTVTTADASIASTDDYKIGQLVEGFNSADLGWGAAGAQAVTLSFWVRSSITGTYAVSLQNSAENRSYPATYTISAANTWEQKTITVPGDTSGTWLTDNGVGVRVNWNLGSGSSFNGTANAWNAADSRNASGQTNWIATSGATFYITGVQLEPGTVATPFERRSYGQELALCQRYFQQLGGGMVGMEEGANNISFGIRYNQPMRAVPTFLLINSSYASRIISGGGVADRSTTVSINGATTINTQAAWLYFQDLGGGSIAGRLSIERNGINYVNASAEL